VIRLVVAACACLGAVDAVAQRYDVVGQCRSGVPNGGYELRMSDGRLRVAGAFSQGRMTGTFIFWTAGGARLAVLPLDNGMRSGTVALWYTAPDERSEAGQKIEAPYVEDRPHGIKRTWYAGGALRTEVRYEHGVIVEARAWSEWGTALNEAEARRLAERDADSEEESYASLVALVRQHLPVCEPESTG
jgi:antitoxin component YwqK of YwqJK toxin-antitoxin module